MTILEDLFYGNIVPCERNYKDKNKADKLLNLICRNENELIATFTNKQKEIFERFKDCANELSCLTEREAFSAGFIMATRIMMEVTQELEKIENI
ncbi:MAG: hypothetical protein IKU25_07545 [Clostridia bacterium]|nr:hypothetical protein [Clostridia bacterium]